MARRHTSAAVEMAVEASVPSIEHASLLELEAAARMAAAGAFRVPTLQTMELLAAFPNRMGLAPEKVIRLREVAAAAYRSVEVARVAGVAIASGSDVVELWQGRCGEESAYKARVLGAHGAIISATRTKAKLFGLAGHLGTVEEGKQADLILDAGPIRTRHGWMPAASQRGSARGRWWGSSQSTHAAGRGCRR